METSNFSGMSGMDDERGWRCMSFKEFREDGVIFADWLPWGALVKSHLMMNKDSSLMATFLYNQILVVEDDVMLGAFEKFSEFFKGLGSGWGINVEVQKKEERTENREQRIQYYLTFVYLPDRKYKGDGKAVFEKGLLRVRESFGVLCDLRLLEGQEYLDYLRSTICFNGSKVEMPEIPMYLDALLTQEIEISIEDEEAVVNESAFQVVTPMGFVSENIHEVLSCVNRLGFDYRFVVRFLFMGDADAKKENERYRKTWFQGRRSAMKLLDYPDFEGVFGYYMAAFVVSDSEELGVRSEGVGARRKAERVEGVLNGLGIVTIVEDYNLQDVWFGTIPGMVRSNVFAPILPVHDVNSLLILPLG